MYDLKNDWTFLQFEIPQEIRDFLIDTFEVYEIRGKVGGCNGISFIVHSNESNHSIPHVHAKYNEYEVSIEISEEAKILVGNLPKQKLKTAQKWVRENKNKLLKDWNELSISANAPFTKTGLSRYQSTSY